MEIYKLKLLTDKRFCGAGTDNNVQVKITGETQEETEWHTLDNCFTNVFDVGTEQVCNITHSGAQIGAPVILSFRLQTHFSLRRLLGITDAWMCDRVDIEHNGENYPCITYDWVNTKEVSFAVGKATLPQKTYMQCLRDMRRKEIEENHTAFQWSKKVTDPNELGWGLSRFILVSKSVPLPFICDGTVGQWKRRVTLGLSFAMSTGMNLFKGFTSSLENLDDYRKLYASTGVPDPPFINDWMEDKEMGRQVLTGLAPLSLKRCSSLPDYCNITQEDVWNSMPAEKTLQSEMQAGRIYIGDYSTAAPLKRNTIPFTSSKQHYYVANCVALFYAAENGDLLPIAIQLVPNDKDSVFTPHDAKYDWLLAKMYFRSTQSSIHEWIYHYYFTHGLSEAFAVAMFREFPRCHPLYKLLRLHLRSVCFINNNGRPRLLPPSALGNKIVGLNSADTLKHFYKIFDLSDLDIPYQIKARGLDDKNVLPNYPYRDDALDMWNAIEKYVSNVIRYFYKSDEDVAGDTELQAWASDVAHECLAWQDGNTRGMPDKILTVDNLIHICTMVIFTSSAQHAAVNFGQMETYQFIPNAPSCMLLPVHKKGEGSFQRVMDTLPGWAISTMIISFSYSLSTFTQDEVFLGDVVEELFAEQEIRAMQTAFKEDLNKLGVKFAERNKTLKYPYTYLLPGKVPVDINI